MKVMGTKRQMIFRWLALLLAFTLVAAACGDDDDEPAAEQPAESEEPAEEPSEEAEEPAEDASDDMDSEDMESDMAAVAAGGIPEGGERKETSISCQVRCHATNQRRSTLREIAGVIR